MKLFAVTRPNLLRRNYDAFAAGISYSRRMPRNIRLVNQRQRKLLETGARSEQTRKRGDDKG